MQAKEMEQKALSLLHGSLKQFDIQINDLAYCDFQLASCLSNDLQQQVTSFEIVKPFLPLDKLKTQLNGHKIPFSEH